MNRRKKRFWSTCAEVRKRVPCTIPGGNPYYTSSSQLSVGVRRLHESGKFKRISRRRYILQSDELRFIIESAPTTEEKELFDVCKELNSKYDYLEFKVSVFDEE